MNLKNTERIDQYYRQNSTEGEKIVTESFADESQTDSLKQLSRKHWDEASTEKVALQHILQQIHQTILPSAKLQETPVRKIIRIYSRIAAFLLLPTLIFSLVLASQIRKSVAAVAEIEAPVGARIQFTLPDGSTGHLNGGSTLTYHTDFATNRLLQLKGEAYFSVVKSKEHPFVVETAKTKVIVLGTKFDVCAYDKDAEVITTLEEGQVRVTDKAGTSLALLKPGEQSVVDLNSGASNIRKVDTRLFTSWKEALLRMDSTPFAEAVKLMERWYGVNIQLDPSLKYSQTYTMTIKTESLRELLDLMKLTTPFAYKIDGDEVTITPEKQIKTR